MNPLKRIIQDADVSSFTDALYVLEDVREQLAFDEAESILAVIAEAIPDEVRKASRDAFAHSGLHGLAKANFDPVAHRELAADKHARASSLAQKHGLVKLAKLHDKEWETNAEKADKLSKEDD